MEHNTGEDRSPQKASVEGVRLGAAWRRRDTGEFQPWALLQARMGGFEKRRGRAWTENDDELWAHVRAQTWGPVEVGDRQVRLPQWLVDQVAGQQLAKIGRERILLAVVWAAFIAGAGGVRLTRGEWTEVLLCSVRSVSNYLRRLEDRGLIVRVRTWQRSPDRPKGSAAHTIIVRPGPALLELAEQTVWEHKRPPRRSGHSKRAGKAAARKLRAAARARRRELSAAAYRTRESRRSRPRGESRRLCRSPGSGAGPGVAPQHGAKFANHPTPPPGGSLPPAPSRGLTGASPGPRATAEPPALPPRPAPPASPAQVHRQPSPTKQPARPGGPPGGRSIRPGDRPCRAPDTPPRSTAPPRPIRHERDAPADADRVARFAHPPSPQTPPDVRSQPDGTVDGLRKKRAAMLERRMRTAFERAAEAYGFDPP